MSKDPLEILTPIFNSLSPERQTKVLQESGISAWPPKTTAPLYRSAMAMGRNTYGDFDEWKPPTHDDIKKVILDAMRDNGLMRHNFVELFFGPGYGHPMPEFSIVITQDDFKDERG